MTFSPEGRQLCYEEYDFADGHGVVKRRLLLLDRRGGSHKELTWGAAPLLNPHWSPTGQRIAMDALGLDGHRRALLLIPGAPADTITPLVVPGRKDRETRVLSWSPDGQRLLVLEGQRDLCVWDVRLGQTPQRGRRIGWDPYIHAAAWSRGGEAVAYVGGQAQYEAQDHGVFLNVWSPKQGVEAVPMPDGLRPMSIDW